MRISKYIYIVVIAIFWGAMCGYAITAPTLKIDDKGRGVALLACGDGNEMRNYLNKNDSLVSLKII